MLLYSNYAPHCFPMPSMTLLTIVVSLSAHVILWEYKNTTKYKGHKDCMVEEEGINIHGSISLCIFIRSPYNKFIP